MDIEIRRLTPDLAEDYVRFFDKTPHSERPDNFKCYCVMWSSDNHHILNRRFLPSEAIRRKTAVRYVEQSILQGYLAYYDGKVVGWCNANTKADCLKCFSWRMNKGSVPTDELAAGKRVKSVFCFAIAPDMRGKGIATLLLERVCQDAVSDGFDFVEAYPFKEFKSANDDFMGPVEMYIKNGFTAYAETNDKRIVVRKALK